MPHIITRAQWGADPSLTRSCAPGAIGTQFAVVFVHHTATKNTYSESQVPSIIRGIYAYHTQGEGWCDIGYNFLIDKYGNVYEGRRGGLRRPVRGAQVLNYNTNTTGVALIGNFETAHPTTAMKSSLVSLVAWRLGAAYHPAVGWTTVNVKRLRRISGHRDAYPTECPGQQVYNWLPTLRTLVADRLGSYRSPIEKAWLATGGDGGSLGPVDVLERGYHGGRTTHFDHGQGFSNTSTGYLLTDGSILSRYHSLGSAGSYLGFPRSDNTRVAGTRAYFVRFAGGRIYNSRVTGAHDLAKGPILTYYLDHGGPAGALGLPLSSVRKTSTGLAARFQGGTVTYNASTGATGTFDPNSYQTYWVPVTKTWTVHGHGYGHGHGMSQYGAQGAAEQGLTSQQILSFYYPHTTPATTGGYIRVWITENSADNVEVLPAKGLQVTDLTDGTTWALPTSASINRWRLLRARNHLTLTVVQYHTPSGWHAWTSSDGRRTFADGGQFRAGGPLTVVLGGQQVRYSGAIRLVPTYPGSTDRYTVNSLGLDNYVRGVVAREMPSYWDAAALQAQAVAARTYAAWERGQSPNAPYQICDTSACQVYGGASAQTTATNAAVAATAHQIRTYGGRPAFTQFASSSGGWTAYGGEPYLPAQPDPYDGWSGNPVHDWTVKLDTTVLQTAYSGSVGQLVDIRVTQRDGHGQWGGRVETVVLDGTKGTVTMSGDDFRAFYGLRSDWFAMEPTPIIKRWFTLGGTGSALGLPTSGQNPNPGAGGALQTFQHGSIYWSAAHGAWDLSGPMLTAYQHWGGPASTVGFPESSEVALSDGQLTGQRVKFQVGYAYWSSTTGTGAHYVYGRIMSAWWKHGSWSGWIGFPISNITSPTTDVLQCTFQHAVISYNRSTKALTITKTS
ncbi:MAG TPA: SpoIID/LytB domain-containing protein [Nocardioidaceae bacterium]|nr:SpoIID/LytB domain-containing protein [Nocardioidaceae bacterium]